VTGHLLTPTVVADHRANGVYTVLMAGSELHSAAKYSSLEKLADMAQRR
jgi:hypothetical protein